MKSSFTPVVGGFYPDPSITRCGDSYFLAHSSFEFFPGVPIWESQDLIHWNQIGNVFDRPTQFAPGIAASSQGVYAPTLRYHSGKFWMVTTNVSGAGSQSLVHAENPEGPWSNALSIPTGGGIDPDLAWDGNNCYLTYSTSSDEQQSISQAKVDLQTGGLLESPRVIWHGTGAQWAESPHLYHHGDWWYLLIAEGGTERGHCISVARSRSPEGPFEGCPNNPIFTHRSLGHPVFSVGHGDMVECPDGTWAMVYLGVRPKGWIPGHHVNGRETFLARIEWTDDWPVVVENGFEIPFLDSSFVDSFEGSLHPRWSSPGLAPDVIGKRTKGGLELGHAIAPNGSPSGMAFHIRDLRWLAEVDVSAQGSPALRLRQDERHWYEVGVQDGRAYATLHIGPVENTFADGAPISGERPTLIIETTESLTDGPDDVLLKVRDDAGTRLLTRADGRYLSTETAGGFIGRVALLHSVAGKSIFKQVRYRTAAP